MNVSMNLNGMKGHLAKALILITEAKEEGRTDSIGNIVNEALVKWSPKIQKSNASEAFQSLLKDPIIADDSESRNMVANLLLEQASILSLNHYAKEAYQRYHLAYLLLNLDSENAELSLEKRHQLMLLREILQLPKQNRRRNAS